MSQQTSTAARVGRIRQYPVDLALISVVSLVAYALVAFFPSGHWLRLIGAIPLVVFLPGYAVVSVLFPGKARSAQQTATTVAGSHPRGIDLLERVGLGFAVSLAITPLAVIVLPFTPWGLATEPLAVALVGTAVVGAQLGAVRRLLVPKEDRFTLSPLRALERFRSESGAVTVSAAILGLAVVLAFGALLLGFVAPLSDGGYTELALLNEDDDGELVTGELPSAVEEGESIPLTMYLANEEGERTEYTAVAQEQRFEDGEITERTTLAEVPGNLSDGSSGTGNFSVTPTAEEGETVRISLLLYYDEPPADPTNENAVEETYFWVTIGDDPADEAADETGDDDDDAADNDDEADDDGDEADDGEADDDDDTDADDTAGDDDADDEADGDETEADADGDEADDDDGFFGDDGLFGDGLFGDDDD